MKLDNIFKTRTMARILASQGQIKKAKSVYHYLIKQHPHEEDLKAELDALTSKQLLPQNPSGTDADVDLTPLYEKWIKTAVSYYRKG